MAKIEVLLTRLGSGLVGDGEHEGTVAAPLVAGVTPVGVHPSAVVAAVRTEHERAATGVGDRVVEGDGIPDTELLHLLIREDFLEPRNQASEGLAVVVVPHAPIPQVGRCAVPVALDLDTGHQRDRVDTPSLETMVLVVAILPRGEEARLRVPARAVARGLEALDLGRPREVETGENNHNVIVFVAFESELGDRVRLLHNDKLVTEQTKGGIVATNLFDNGIHLAHREIGGCKFGHDILLALTWAFPFPSNPRRSF